MNNLKLEIQLTTRGEVTMSWLSEVKLAAREGWLIMLLLIPLVIATFVWLEIPKEGQVYRWEALPSEVNRNPDNIYEVIGVCKEYDDPYYVMVCMVQYRHSGRDRYSEYVYRPMAVGPMRIGPRVGTLYMIDDNGTLSYVRWPPKFDREWPPAILPPSPEAPVP